ncbi:retropepsin-like aspartic protease family protein [Hyphomicrobium sp.]|jgi:aspartyl protease family protein|uniref:retropepsin-like aspartic protease family protein n=1 Tax=Hyphomicrobium sp. TaxID=82 RepID=UPI002B7EA963|nr:TIGR02281 family clan AA aspartic protease [Hyphomicrobium sp.]HVZ05182.1 TIGR02281 family clan AA aspartic protease [Hyphomicrobium sp.]
MFALLLAAIVTLGGAVLFVLCSGSSLEAVQGPPIAIAVVGALILLYLLSSHGSEQRLGRLPALIALALVGALGVIAARSDTAVLITGYFNTAKLDETAHLPSPQGPASVRIRKLADGFVANTEINGQPMQALVDSGAATIVLRRSDAEKAGVDVRSLTFDTPLKTANGTTYLAPVRLKSVRIGEIVADDVEALVAKPGALNENLLGQSFLRHLTSYEVAGDFVTLRQ